MRKSVCVGLKAAMVLRWGGDGTLVVMDTQGAVSPLAQRQRFETIQSTPVSMLKRWTCIGECPISVGLMPREGGLSQH